MKENVLGKVKRLKGLTIIAFLLIILGFFNLSSPFYCSYILQNIPYLIYSILYGLVAIIIGLGIFTLKKWARVAAIIVITISAIDAAYKTIIDIKRWGEGQHELQITFLLFSALLIMIAVGLWGIILYYLTRPKVKEQFNDV